MLQKWKIIIKNWINCYFNDSNTLEQNVNLDSLINIISHLRENFSLDESKSSSLEAQTVEEFIVEKYSEFKFENGTVVASNEEEIYLAASLLLFFVCVNSKDMYIKSAMCSNLSREDQEVILKFSKSLMECSPVTCRDVQAAITDACGIETANLDTASGHTMVAETPPVLRSLHSEVRRLQAALEAERFDRNYLQEELTRTNSRLEKLLHDKEQYKVEIVDLKTKISMCCGQEDLVSGVDVCTDSSAKLVKQLQEMEERLVRTQEQLDDITYARESYKAKVEELKQDRDKWLSLSQQESSRATTLSEELEMERRHVQSLRELVAELRQHNRLNGLDSSQLECDDADASIHSLQHNLSVCSEVCANVVEVQLGEERAKIVVLKQQIQGLQEQINELSQKMETEKHGYEKSLTERENEIFNLRHRINEEIEEKNHLKAYFNDEVSKLHNEMNELEQKLKDNNDSSRQMIEQKMSEIQTLQEEKLSLLQSLSDETTKLEKIIHQLKCDIENEKQMKLNMKESYENHIMKLNEKVLNRNNELVELQNNVFEKSEMIEALHLDLRKERENRDELTSKYCEDIYHLNEHNKQIECELHKKIEETNVMQQNFEQRIAVLLNEVDHFKTMTCNFQEQCRNLEATKEQLQSEVSTVIMKLDEVEKEMENVRNSFSEEKESLKHQLDEKNAIITTLQTHLEDEIHFKIRLQDELQKLQAAKMFLSEEIVNLNMLLSKAQTDLTEKDKTTETISLSLKEENLITDSLKTENSKLEKQIKIITHELKEKNHNHEVLKDELETITKTFKNEIQDKDDMIKKINNKISTEIVEKENMEKKISTLTNEISNLEKALNERCNEILQLQTKCEKLSQTIADYNNTFKTIEDNLNKEKKKCEQLEQIFDTETTKMLVKLTETEKTIKHLTINSNKALRSKEQEIIVLNNEVDSLKSDLEKINNNVTLLQRENETLLTKLNAEISYKNKFEKEYQNQCKLRDSVTAELNCAIVQKNDIINKLNMELDTARNTINEKCAEIQELKIYLTETSDSGKELVCQRDNLITELNKQINTVSEELDEARKVINEKFKDQEELNKQLSSVLNTGLEKLVQDLKKDEITNEILQRLVAIPTCDIPNSEKCDLLIEIASTLSNELAMRKHSEEAHENSVHAELRDVIQQKEIKVFELQTEVNRLQQLTNENKIEFSKQKESYTAAFDTKEREMQLLQKENQSLTNNLNDVKLQLEIKVHSLKEKLIDNENLTEKLKRTYESQIDNLNVMITKLTGYLKDKTVEIETARKEKERLQQVIEENAKAIKSLEDELKTEKQNEEKLISDFESERQVLKNMVTVTESVMEDQKVALNKVLAEHLKVNETLQEEIRTMKELADKEKKDYEMILQEKENALDSVFKELSNERFKYDTTLKDSEIASETFENNITKLNNEIKSKLSEIGKLENENKNLTIALAKSKEDRSALEKLNTVLLKENESLTTDLQSLKEKLSVLNDIDHKLQEKTQTVSGLQENNKLLDDKIMMLQKEKNDLIKDKLEVIEKQHETKIALDSYIAKENEEICQLKKENTHLISVIEENKTVITNLELLIKHELEQNQQLREDMANEKLNLANKCSLLQDCYTKAEKQLEEKQEERVALQKEIKTLQAKVNICEDDLRAKDGFISKITKDKDAVISVVNKELLEEKSTNENYQEDLKIKIATINELQRNMNDFHNQRETVKILRKENEELIKAIGQRETFAVQEKTSSLKQTIQAERELRDLHHQVDNSSSDITQSSLESLKTITDLEKIIHDKNRTITTLQSDVTYLKTLIAESETKLLDVSKELEVSKETCQQLSSQLKKLVHQKNDEIAELKKQLSKMSVTENRATQIIKVSAKYQAMILKRIAEIKTNTVLKELTNFGNSNNCDNELKRSLNSGSITMEDLENFLETTDRHLKRCSEKQIALQKERDRLTEVNRIHESEIINMKKFLTELSVRFQTFSSIKDLYAQKLSRVISVQRTVRREILNSEGRITDACMCKLERGYAAVMQDLAECAMTLQRWAERCLGRTLSPEKIKQAFMPDVDRASLAPASFQNSGLEVQLEELENSFEKLLEEVSRALKGEGAKDAQAVTVMEVRAEYEDKLNRMKAKMKQLYTEQISVFKEKQRDEIAALERELQKARDKLAESSKAYEEHIRGLTTELWSVGEKFLMKKDEAEWLRRKHKSGSLMSLQHVHSSGLLPPQEEPSRPSDTHSLRSLPVNNNNTSKREGRGLHMSDEEGEVFDNRWLQELAGTPRREPPAGQRLSELQWRNSLCPPHLKSSYPAETQFTPALDEEDIKCIGTIGSTGVRQQRKEVGIIAYKKPGPPTPSKQAGRLSATDSELRESLRVEAEPQPRKTSTPSRIRALFRSSRNDTAEGTPRSRRLSNIFRKK